MRALFGRGSRSQSQLQSRSQSGKVHMWSAIWTWGFAGEKEQAS